MASKVTLGGELLFPSEYLAAVEFKGRDVTLTITRVEIAELQLARGGKEAKPVLHFGETRKKVVLNKTNAGSIAVMYGAEAQDWVGKRVTFFPTKTQCGRETVDCIRVRERVPPPKAAPAQANPPAAAEQPAPADTGEPEPVLAEGIIDGD